MSETMLERKNMTQPETCAEYVRRVFCEEIPAIKLAGENFDKDICWLKRERLDVGDDAGEEEFFKAYNVAGGSRLKRRVHHARPCKVIVFLGETGSGKSTLINGLINALFKVKFEDSFRFKLVKGEEHSANNQAKSQTNHISLYIIDQIGGEKLHGDQRSFLDCPLIVVDTPGFCDTGGFNRDQKTLDMLSKTLTRVFPMFRINFLNQVVLVVKSSATRLVTSARYVLDQCLSPFAKDVENIIVPVFTFADQGEPQSLAMLNEAKIPFPKTKSGEKIIVKFNNSILYESNLKPSNKEKDLTQGIEEDENDLLSVMGKDDDSHIYEMRELHWRELTRQYQRICALLQFALDLPLNKSLHVIDARSTVLRLALQIHQYRLQGQGLVSKFISLFEKHVSLKPQLRQLEDSTTAKTSLVTREERAVPDGQYALVCSVCSYTCHLPCGRRSQQDAVNCSVMKNGACSVCPGKCAGNLHNPGKWYYIYTVTQSTMTLDGASNKYEESRKELARIKQDAQRVASELKDCFEKHEKYYDQLKASLYELKARAFRPKSYNSIVDYIDVMLQSPELDKGLTEELSSKRQHFEIIVKCQNEQMSKLVEEVKNLKLKVHTSSDEDNGAYSAMIGTINTN